MRTAPCGKCGSPGRRWALLCGKCATRESAHEALILLVSPTLSYRVGKWLREASMVVGIAGVVLLGAGLVGRIGNYFLGEWFGNILVLLAFFASLCILSLPFFMLPDIWRDQDFGSVSNWRASKQLISTWATSTLDELPERETEFRERSIDLHDVKRVAVKQSWIGRALGYGDVLLYTTPSGQADMAFCGIADPAEFAQWVRELVASAPALPKPPHPAAATTAASPSRSWLKKGRNAVEAAAGCVIPIGIVGLLMFAGWWWWSQHGLTMAPGESREIHMQGMGAVALREVQWTPEDTYALGMRIAAPPGVEVTFVSASVKPSELGEGGGTLIGIDYTIRIQVAPDVPPGDAEILLQFEHPKLKPPYVHTPPVEKFRLKIRRNL